MWKMKCRKNKVVFRIWIFQSKLNTKSCFFIKKIVKFSLKYSFRLIFNSYITHLQLFSYIIIFLVICLNKCFVSNINIIEIVLNQNSRKMEICHSFGDCIAKL